MDTPPLPDVDDAPGTSGDGAPPPGHARAPRASFSGFDLRTAAQITRCCIARVFRTSPASAPPSSMLARSSLVLALLLALVVPDAAAQATRDTVIARGDSADAAADRVPPEIGMPSILSVPSVLRTAPAADAPSLAADALAAADTLAAAVRALRGDLGQVARANDSLREANARLDQANARLQAKLDSTRRADEPFEPLQRLGLKLLETFAIFLATLFLVRGVAYLVHKRAQRSARRRLVYKRVVPAVRLIAWTTAVVVVVRYVFHIGPEKLVAAAAALGVALGFAAQDLLRNVFGGLVILFDQPFQVGDKIRVGDSYGEVMTIGLRSTRLTTPDDNLVSVPNAQVVDGQVSNANAGALDCQVVTHLFLPGWADAAAAKEVAYEAASHSRYVYLKKPITVLVTDEMQEGAHVTHLRVKAYVLDARYESLLMSDVTERARAAFLVRGLLANPDADARSPAPDGPPDYPQLAPGDGVRLREA